MRYRKNTNIFKTLVKSTFLYHFYVILTAPVENFNVNTTSLDINNNVKNINIKLETFKKINKFIKDLGKIISQRRVKIARLKPNSSSFSFREFF